MMIIDRCQIPIVLAPLAGGPSTPQLAAAVVNAGGFAFLGSGYRSALELADDIATTRQLTTSPFGVNLFVPTRPTDPALVAGYADRLRKQNPEIKLGQPRFSDDDWGAKLELLNRDPVAVVSFTFGCPPPRVVRDLHEAGSEVWVTVTSPAEATQAGEAGADVLVVQGSEAGGHRGGFNDPHDATDPLPVLALLQLIAAATTLPLIATGGITTGAGVAAVLAAGARAAALGTAFLRCPEAGTSAVHRAALSGDTPTKLTKAFTGRTARGIRNRFLDQHTAAAPAAYPEVHYLTAPLRQAGRAHGDPEVVNLWAGQTYPLAPDGLPARELVRRLHQQAIDAADRATAILTKR